MYDGANPFQHLPGDPWGMLLQKASADSQSANPVAGYEVGEDSGFCDLAKSKGFRIVVDTGCEIGHIDSVVLNGATHKERMDEREKESRLHHGVLT
jgi:hypothetical protein